MVRYLPKHSKILDREIRTACPRPGSDRQWNRHDIKKNQHPDLGKEWHSGEKTIKINRSRQ